MVAKGKVAERPISESTRGAVGSQSCGLQQGMGARGEQHPGGWEALEQTRVGEK